MDLGISGRHAIVTASSRGLGFACAEALVREGVHVVINGRDARALESAAQQLRDICATVADATVAGAAVAVSAVCGDVEHASTQAALFDACPEPDILVNNNGGPNPGQFGAWTRDDWIAAIDSNMLAPIAMIQGAIDGMVDRRFGRIVNITSAMVKSPRSPMGLSSAARTGLTAVCKGLSRDVAHANVTINNLLPERFDTGRQRQMAELAVAFKGITLEEAYDDIAQTVAAKRLGRPEEFGAACAFLCSAHAGFMSGQNLGLDGGTYEGLI
jgi:3-oxoacyl-[acyl-carrier protein] reductase